MLKTEKILNDYGLSAEEAEALLEVDVISSLMKAKEEGGDALALQVATIDEGVAQYLNRQEVKEILEENRKEPIGVDDDLDFDLDEIDFDDIDLDEADDYDIRITDTDASPPPMREKKPIEAEEAEVEEIDEPEIPTIPSVMVEDISASTFFSDFVRNHVPQVDTEGAIVFEHSEYGVRVRGIYKDDFGVIGSLPLSSAKMDVMVLGRDAEKVVEYLSFTGYETKAQRVDAELLTLPLEEVSSAFNTQQFLRGGREVDVSFQSISSILNRANEGDSTALDFPSLGKAVHPHMVKDSVYYYTPDQLYGMANCDEFFTASVGGYRYITNYCEANDLKQLRIFESGGSHLNIPFNNTAGKTISNSKIEDDTSLFSMRVGGVIQDSYSVNERLYMVGFTQVLPKEIKYGKVDNLSGKAGYFVFAAPSNSRIFYVPAVIFNYFLKFYGIDGMSVGLTAHEGQYTLFFRSGLENVGFIMIEEKFAPSGAPARMLPENPVAYKEKIMGENLSRFSNLVDVQDMGKAQFEGEVVEREVEEVVEGDALQEFVDLIAELRMVLELMEEGVDDAEIAELNDAIEGAQLMIETLSEEAGVEVEEPSIDEVELDLDDDSEMLEEVQNTPPVEDEAGLEAIGDDTDILPTPSADDPVAEEIVEAEKEDVLEADDAEDEDDFDDIELVEDVEFEDEDLVTPEPEDDMDDIDFDDIDFEKGGLTPQKVVSLLTDEEVAQTLAEKMMESLEAVEYGDMTEQDMVKEAMKDMMHSRKMLTEILIHES